MKIKSGMLALFCALSYSLNAVAYETTARNAILMDFDTGEYLYEKNITEAVPPASMSKLMTVYILMEKIKDVAPSYTVLIRVDRPFN